MLKKPFVFVDNVDLNNYHLLGTNQEIYLATETFARFGKKNNGKLIQGMKMLPLNSVIIKLFMDFVNVKQLDDVKVEWGLEPEKRYAILDINKTRKELDEIYKPFKDSMFSFKPIYHNETLKAFVKEGNELLAVEKLGAYTNRYWFASSNKLGNLIIYVFLLQGRPAFQTVVSVNNYVFGIETIKKVMSKLEELTNKDETVETNDEENLEQSEVNE